jgi:hypothetical protein
MKIPKVIIYVLAVIGLVYVFQRAFISFGPISLCETSNIGVAMSPSKQHVAELEIRKCDDKPEPIIQLVMSNPSKPNQGQSVAIGIASTTDLDLTWLSGNRLQVAYPLSFELTQQPSEIDGIEILFVTKSISNPALKQDAPSARPLATR